MYPPGEHRGLGGGAALCGRFSGPLLREHGDVFGQPIDIDDVGIEVVCVPFLEFASTRPVRTAETVVDSARLV